MTTETLPVDLGATFPSLQKIVDEIAYKGSIGEAEAFIYLLNDKKYSAEKLAQDVKECDLSATVSASTIRTYRRAYVQ